MIVTDTNPHKLISSLDEEMMRLALFEAQKAYDLGEVPVGAVITDHGGVVTASAHNLRETWHDATAHAELLAIRQACEKFGSWRLAGCTLYVTLEPCPMCAGAIIMSRLCRVVYGAPDSKAGACESVFTILNTPALNHSPDVTAGVLEEESRELLQRFFAERR